MKADYAKHGGWWKGGLKIAGGILAGILVAVVLAFLFGYFVQLLWNWIMPEIFGLPKISYWQGFGIIVLARLIFGGLGTHGKEHDQKKKKRLPAQGDEYDRSAGEWKPESDKAEWRYYKDYWQEEGKTAFEKYVEKRKSEQGKRQDKNEEPSCGP